MSTTGSVRCLKCGSEITIHLNDMRLPCFNASPPVPIGNIGWTCPRCGRGNAPSKMTCPCIPPDPPVVTAAAPAVG